MLAVPIPCTLRRRRLPADEEWHSRSILPTPCLQCASMGGCTWQHPPHAGTAELAAPPAWETAGVTGSWGLEKAMYDLWGEAGTVLTGRQGNRLGMMLGFVTAPLHLCKEKGWGCPPARSYEGCSHWIRFNRLQQMNEKRVRLYCSSHKELKTCLKVYNYQEMVCDKPFSALLCFS